MKDDKFFEEKINKATNVDDIKYIPEDRTAENNKLILEFETKQKTKTKSKKLKMPLRYIYTTVASVFIIIAITLLAVFFPFNNEKMETESYSIRNPNQTYTELVFPDENYYYERGIIYKTGTTELYLDVRYVYDDDVIDMVIVFADQEFPNKTSYTSTCSEEDIIAGFNIKYKLNENKSYAYFDYKDVTYYVSYTSENTNAIFAFLEKLIH